MSYGWNICPLCMWQCDSDSDSDSDINSDSNKRPIICINIGPCYEEGISCMTILKYFYLLSLQYISLQNTLLIRFSIEYPCY